MRTFAMTGMVTASLIPSIIGGSDMRATPPAVRMSAGTRSSAMTAAAPADSATRAWSAVTTSMITPPLSISASPDLTRKVPSSLTPSMVRAGVERRAREAAPALGLRSPSQHLLVQRLVALGAASGRELLGARATGGGRAGRGGQIERLEQRARERRGLVAVERRA